MKRICSIFGFALLLVLLMLSDLSIGSVWINPLCLFQDATVHPLDYRIILDLRLPRVLTAVLAGVGLSVSGLMMQTLFRNPLAGPYILGVSSGAGLGVALLTMCGSLVGSMMGHWSTAVAAIVGSTAVLMLILIISHRVQSNVTLLIAGMMIGSIAGALVNLIQNFANPDALKLFIIWTLGSLNGVGWSEMPSLACVILVGCLLAAGLIKPLNGMTLGDDYARALGVRVERVRLGIIIATGLLAGGITAFAGPIAFVGVAVPHLARGLANSSDHRITMPLTALIGACLMLICDMLSNIGSYPLPISTMSALFGAPIVLWIILKKQH